MAYPAEAKFPFIISIARDIPGRDLFKPDSLHLTWTVESISDNIQAQWQETQVMGRSESWQSWGSTGSRQISFEVTLQAQEDPYEDVVKPANWMKALQMPYYSDGRVYKPPIVHVYYGSLIPGIRVRCAQSSVTWLPPFEPTTMYAHRATVSLAFTAASSRAQGWERIYGNLPNG